MNRNYDRFNRYLDELYADIYPQPYDVGHDSFAKAYIDWAVEKENFSSVLDVGCGEGFCRKTFIEKSISWEGVTVGKDYEVCQDAQIPNVYEADMSFLPLPDSGYDAVFARHVLEHSPFPYLTLMEWRRVSRGLLLLVLPTPDYWGWGGKNHYSVFNKQQWWYAFSRTGWKVIHEHALNTNNKLFLDHYLPHIKDPQKRAEIHYPGAPVDVEWWFILEKAEEITE